VTKIANIAADRGLKRGKSACGPPTHVAFVLVKTRTAATAILPSQG
jgi:hypothetical protein